MNMIYKILTPIIICIAVPVLIVCAMIYISVIVAFPSLKFKATNIIAQIVLSFLGVKIKLNKSFPNGGPFFVMYNHTSFIDAFIFFSFATGRFTGITAKKNYKIPVFGWMAKQFKAIPIDRNNLKDAIKSMNTAEQRLKEGYHICILPEGTRSLDGNMLAFKKGGFHMAINTGAKILPIGVSGAFKYKPKNRWFIIPGAVHVNIGEPIDASRYTSQEISELINITYQHIYSLSKGISDV